MVARAVNVPDADTSKTDIEKLPAPPEVDTEGGISASRRSGTAQAVTCYLFKGGECEEDIGLERVARLARDDRNMAWVDLSDYTPQDLEKVAAMLNLHATTVRATLSDWERPRVDVFPEYFYLSVTVVRADQPKRKLVAGELNIIVGRNFLVTAHKRPLEFGDKILQRLKQSPEVATLHTAYALYIILEELVEYYQGIFEHVDEEIEEAEEHALTQSSDTFLADLLALKRYIFVLGRFAEQHRSVFAVLTRPDFTHVQGEQIEPYFRELQENLARLIDKLSAGRDSITEAFDIYVSQVSHRTNQLIRVLTLISTVVLPATLVVGFFSTNFTSLPGLRSVAAFWVMVVLLLVMPVSILFFIRRRRLI
ncbi:MAG: magnesium transporter CorA family protein [Candidatus Dormibacteraeota bacterium]|nr:magnesium transporter CorA family protein [Candidatus Dormibacteraeota bacterium]